MLIRVIVIETQIGIQNLNNKDETKRINKFFETEFTKNVNVKKQRRFDRSTLIFKLKSKYFCMRLK